MKFFWLLPLFVGLGAGRPDVSLGYKYSAGNNNNYVGPPPYGSQSGSVIGSVSGAFGSLENSFGSYSGSQGYGFDTSFVPHYQQIDNSYIHNSHKTSYEADTSPIVTKNFYVHAAPEEPAQEPIVKRIVVGRPSKNYKILFIKAPIEKQRPARIEVSYPQNEDKTVVYVLSKKAEPVHITEVASPQPVKPSKPDVFFIKYKTQEEALHAQHKIQQQYDALGGSSYISQEGVPPVSSVVGSLGQGVSYQQSESSDSVSGSVYQHSSSSDAATSSGSVISQEIAINDILSGSVPQSSYLPPSQAQ